MAVGRLTFRSRLLSGWSPIAYDLMRIWLARHKANS
jgi:hypothetical protein